eukprot:Opistho-1_new@48175
MHAPVLGAALQGRDDLAGVQQARGIEGGLERQHLRALGGRELHAHAVELLDAHAVFAGDRAAELHRGLQNLGTEQLATVQLVGVGGVEQDQRVQIAIAGMEDIGAAQAVLLLHLRNRQEDGRQVLARDGGVHAHVVGADAARGGEGVLAPAPELQALGLGLADLALRGAAVQQHGQHARDLLGHLLGRAVALAQQDGLGRQVVARVNEVLHGGGHGLVHHLQAGRDDARGDDVGHRVAGFADVVEAGHDAAGQLRLGHQLDRHLRDDGQHALAADDQWQQIHSGRVHRLRSELDRLALDGEAAHAQHVVQGQAVLEAVHAARVLGDIAADGPCTLR